MKSKQTVGGRATVVTVVAVLLGGAAACGDVFGGEESCKETRTCSKPDEGDGGADGSVGGTGSSEAGEPGAADDSSSAGSGGGEPLAECSVPADCSNADPGDGEETCFHGECVPGNPPPTVVSVTPANEAVSVEPDGSIVVELNEPLDEATVTSSSVRILDGDHAVSGKLSYADNEITFVPDKPLALLSSYVVSVSTGITDVDGAALIEPFSSTFKVRDGSWAVQTVVASAITEVSPTIQLNDDGDALLAWVGGALGACPTTARWFNRGSALATARTFNNGREQYCRAVRSAVSRNGLALLSWYEEDNQGATMATVEFRNGQWGQVTARSDRYDYNGAAAVSDDGTMHHVSSGGDVQVWQTTPAGVWSTQGRPLAPRPSLDDPHVAVAANGDAVAVWRDQDASSFQSVYAARFSSETAKWSSAAAIPGSLANKGADTMRGEPQAAFDDANVPVIVWRRGAELVATHYDAVQSVWSQPQPISGQVTGLTELEYNPEPPALVFDGHGFVAAFTVLNGSGYDNYVVRYDRDDQVWKEPELVSTAAARGSARMPRLAADARGNLLLVWAKAKSAGVYEFVSRRFDASTDTWSAPAIIPGAIMKNTELVKGLGSFALGGNAHGLAALSFADWSTATSYPARLQLASYY
jgi:hypothetical protein